MIARDRGGRVLLLAEARVRCQTTGDWAAQFRKNMLSRGTLPAAPYFLVATPDRMYFWRQDEGLAKDAPPHFTLDATRELRPYLDAKSRAEPEKIARSGFVLTILTWLKNLAESGPSRAAEDSSLQWLSESGLLELLHKSSIDLG